LGGTLLTTIRFIKLVDLIVLTILVYCGVCYVVDPQWDPTIAALAAGAFAGVMAAKRFPRRDEYADQPQVMD
jgi:hypothetical protein